MGAAVVFHVSSRGPGFRFIASEDLCRGDLAYKRRELLWCVFKPLAICECPAGLDLADSWFPDSVLVGYRLRVCCGEFVDWPARWRRFLCFSHFRCCGARRPWTGSLFGGRPIIWTECQRSPAPERY